MSDFDGSPPERVPLLQRLRQRKLVQWALAYLAGSWVLIEVASTFQEGLGWPTGLFPILIAVLSVGFVVTLVLAWYHGEQGRQSVSGPELLIITGILGVSALLFGVLSRSADPMGDGGTRAGAPSGSASVAVLPFVNMSGNEDNEYFSDGMTEEILNALAQLPGLRVPGRTSSFAFKGGNLTIRQIADTLNVDHVLEGSVRREGNRVLITAQLVDAQVDAHLWSNTYQRDLSDVFAMQREIALAISDALQIELGADEPPLAVEVPTTNTAAHDLYLRGRFELSQRGSHVAEARRYFEQAIDLDPEYARAYGGLALAEALSNAYPGVPPGGAERALAAAARGLALDSTLSEPHTARGYLPTRIGGIHAAERELRQAIRLDPNDANAHHFLGWALMAQGRWDEALESVTRATLLDPSNPAHRWRRANAYNLIGRWSEAEADAREALRISPDDPYAQSVLEMALVLSGRREALAAANPQDEGVRLLLAAMEYPERLDDALVAIRDLPGWNNSGVGSVAAWLGRHEIAIESFERAAEVIATGNITLGFIPHSSFQSAALTPVGQDPRFQAVLRRLGIESRR